MLASGLAASAGIGAARGCTGQIYFTVNFLAPRVGAGRALSSSSVVRLTHIYARLGDGGDTPPGRHQPRAPEQPPVVAYGDVDELNATIGVARAQAARAASDRWLAVIQNDLFDLGADLCVPARRRRPRAPARPPLQVERLERWCDEVNEELRTFTSFVLPGGSPAAAALHHARTVCRRAERSTVALADAERSPRGARLPQPPLRPALHPGPRRQPRRRRATSSGSPGRAASPPLRGRGEADPARRGVDAARRTRDRLSQGARRLEGPDDGGIGESAPWPGPRGRP